MQKLIFASAVFASLMTAGVAAADHDRYDRDRSRYERVVVPLDDRDVWTVDRDRADRRRGTAVLRVKRGARGSELSVVASDPSIRIRMIEVVFRDGRSVRVRGRGASAIALGALRRADQIIVDYVNRSGYAGEIALVADDRETAYEYPRSYRRY
jgi:hypothetical protein